MRVELVDQSGSILKTSVQGFKNVGPGSTIILKGKVAKKGKHIRVLATQFYVPT